MIPHVHPSDAPRWQISLLIRFARRVSSGKCGLGSGRGRWLWQTALWSAAWVCLNLAGCDTTRAMKVKNPVVGPPPIRYANLSPNTNPDELEDDQRLAEVENDDKIITTSASVQEEDIGRARVVSSGEVAAFVNGRPIFYDDILEPIAGKLVEYQKKEKPSAAELHRTRRELVRRELNQYIERELLLQGLKTRMKDEQMEGMQKFMDKAFHEEELVQKMKQFNVATVGELEVELRRQGTSIASMKTAFKNQRMAQQYLAMKNPHKAKKLPDRMELLAYYHEHAQDYEVLGEVLWQQISLKYEEHGGRRLAAQLADKIQEELRQGADFSTLAKEYSSGATASSGGKWDWTKEGSVALPAMDAALFSLPPGQVSESLVGPNSIEIVKVVDRKDHHRRQFEDVQDDIRKAMKEAEFREVIETAIADLKDDAKIVTIFDEENKAAGIEILPNRRSRR